jgi:hypothetical protein
MANERVKRGIKLVRVPNQEANDLISNYKCKICNQLVNDPKKCTNCKSVFCNFCIEELTNTNTNTNDDKTFSDTLTKDKKCVCGEEFVNEELTAQEKLALNNILVKCTYSSLGCRRFCKYKNLNKHEKICKFRRVFEKEQHEKAYIKKHRKSCQNVGYISTVFVWFFFFSIFLLACGLFKAQQNKSVVNYYEDRIKSLDGFYLSKIKKISWLNGQKKYKQNYSYLYGSSISTKFPLDGNFKVFIKIKSIDNYMEYQQTTHKLYLGISPDKMDNKGEPDTIKGYYALDLVSGNLISKINDSIHYTHYKFKNGDVITISFKNKNIYFYVNDIDLGLAFDGIHFNRLYPFTFVMENDSVKLLGYVNNYNN